MAIVGVPGWIGASAVSETGERWMAQAGAKVGLSTPFWMSSLAGRSANCMVATAQYMRQAATVWGANTTASGEAAHGTINGANMVGLNSTLVYIENNSTSLIPSLTSMGLQGGPARNITVNYGGQTAVASYIANSSNPSQYFMYSASTAFVNMLKSTGVLRQLTVS
ncbi:tail fiber adhesin [Edwardsiella phage PEi20]|uniref:Distal long tail fiber assembly catalyst n=1 Tax=Edwardsiella phage PEi20 TaxID=1608310 RepID=A0A0B6VSW1_9CAUD|nr:tail fiber adhesin [Edwardsiella phage PEi20]BAQ22925.1 distal long tail fiber assembly catalyst [Edwardsiella phage PEi20]